MSKDQFLLKYRQQLLTFGLFCLGLVGVLSYSRGFWIGAQGWGVFHWYVDYSHGFIKRGLFGTAFQAIYPPLSLAQTEVVVGTLHTVVAVLLGILLFRMARETIASQSTTTFLIWLLLVTSQFPPTLAYLSGFLDIYLFLLLLGAVLLWRQGKLWGVAAIGFVGPFIHEMFVFLWITFLFLEALHWKEHSLRLVGLLAALSPGISAIILMTTHSQDAATLAVQQVPVDDQMRAVLLERQFGQTTGPSLRYMLRLFLTYSDNVLAAFSYYLLPTLGMITLASLKWSATQQYWRWSALALVGAALGPGLILLLAWDLSRFLVMTSFCAALAFWAIDQRARP